MDYTDIHLAIEAHVATITIDRPEVLNAFRARTVEELTDALQVAGWDPEVGVIVLTGAGERAFCTGGDQSLHGDSGYSGGRRGIIGFPIEELHTAIRDVPVPVIAKVRGYAIGGGNVLATICDLTIAAESAVFGQVGPKVGSVDPGFGTAYLARAVGEKKAREMWYLCRRYGAAEAERMGLVNEVVADEELDATVGAWCEEIVAHSPTAIALAKRSFNADTDHQRGIGGLGMAALSLFYGTDESKEGTRAFLEKRPPDFRGVGR